MRTLLRLLLGLVFTVVVLVIAAIAVLAFVPSVGDVSRRDLAASLARELEVSYGPPGERACRPAGGGGRYDCRVAGRSGSGSVGYRLLLTERRCWRARRTGSTGSGEGRPPARRAEGCVKLRDQVRLTDRL